MATTTLTATERTLTLNDEERVLIQGMFEQALRDTRVEVHRTHTPDYRASVQHREEVIRGLLSKLGVSVT